MEEGQVSVDGTTHAVPQPFTVIATQNTVEQNKAYDLPMAELDRFMMKLHLGYPDAGEETAMLGEVVGHHPIEELSPVATLEALQAAQDTVAEVTVEEPIRAYATRLANYTREHAQLGVSPRGSISLLQAAQARAVLDGRDYVVPDDLQQEAPVVLPHRIRTDSSEQTGSDLVEDALEAVAVE
jgi:MoxR-like ATPase